MNNQNLLHIIMKHVMGYYKNIIIPMIASWFWSLALVIIILF